MTITLVSPPTASAQTAAVDAGSAKDTPADGGLFAALLLGQLIPATPEALPATGTTASPQATDDGIVDPSAVLAALPLPVEPGRDAGSTRGDLDASADSALSALRAAGQSRPDPLSAQSSASIAARDATSAQNSLPSAETGEGKPAKIAAAPAFSLPDALLPTAKERVGEEKAPTQPAHQALPALNQNALAAENREASLAVKTPVRDQGWDTDFSQKIVWLAKNDKHSAQLSLNPAQMGPIDISITVDKGNVTASFASASADVRGAIETALPRLREMFANAGIQLGQTNVGAETFQRQPNSDGGSSGGARWTADNAILAGDPVGPGLSRMLGLQQGSGMVDIFA